MSVPALSCSTAAFRRWGNLVQEWQSHSGAVDIGTTPSIQYTYADGATSGVAAYLRLTQTAYPNGRTVNYNYPTGVDAIMSRLGSITDSDSTTDAAYTYLGLDTIVKEDFQQAGVNLNYDPSGSNSYTGFDRFGRVIDQLWATDGGSPTTVDGYGYTYDPAGNVLTKTNATDAALDESYTYDAANRLTDWYVGGSGTPSQAWSLDSLGNDMSSGTFNASNEETPTSGSSGYDAAGNMTTLQSGDTAIYDAWNRLVEVDNGSGIVAQYQYDGTGQRTEELSNFTGASAGSVTHYYLSGQQVVETRVTASASATPVAADVQYQYIWSPIYVDTPVLRDTYGSGSLVSGDRLYYTTDANHNVTALVGKVSGTWQVVERYSYTAYGVSTVYDSGWTAITGNVSQYGNTRLFGGMDLDALTGEYYDNARWYDAGLGRFISTDPIKFRGGTNPYEYVGDSPENRVDPLGLWTVNIGGSVSGMWGVVGVGGSAGIVIDGSGNVGGYTTVGGGAGVGAKGSGGLSIGSSNAATIGDIAGPFGQVSVGAAGAPACRATSTLGLAQMERIRLEVGMGT